MVKWPDQANHSTGKCYIAEPIRHCHNVPERNNSSGMAAHTPRRNSGRIK